MLPFETIARITPTTLIFTCSCFASDFSGREKHFEAEKWNVNPGVVRAQRSKGEGGGSETLLCVK